MGISFREKSKNKATILAILSVFIILNSFSISNASEAGLINLTNISTNRTIERRPLGSVYGIEARVQKTTEPPTTTSPPTTTPAPTTSPPTTPPAPTTAAPITLTAPKTKAPSSPPPTTAPPTSKGICGPTTILLLAVASALGADTVKSSKGL